MTRHLHFLIATTGLCLLATLTPIHAQLDKWSRQLEASDAPGGDPDSFDWVPLAQPVDSSASKDRSANGRVLSYSQAFPPNARFSELPSKLHNAPTTQHQGFDFPYQFQRFANPPQAQPLRSQHTVGSLKNGASAQSQEPTSQSFFKFEMPYHESNRPAGGPPTVQTGYQIQHTFGGGAHATLFSSPLFSQQSHQHPVFPSEFHPAPSVQKPLHEHLHKPLHQQNFIEDTLPLKNTFRESKPLPTQQSFQSVTPQVFPVDPQPEQIFELQKPSSFQAQSPFHQSAPAAPSASAPSAPSAGSNSPQQEEVQLLYVPYDTLYNQQQPQGPPPSRNPSAFEVNKFNLNPGLPSVNPYQINQFYTQDPLGSLEPNYYTTSTTTGRPRTTSAKPSNVFQNFASPQYTTAKPKPKAHQPPLAMFLVRSNTRPTQSDVVAALRNANTIAVIDAPTKHTPDIFVGPSGMPIPAGYVKFDLPYLSQLSHTHDLHEVPFFVAPLSYRTPSGFNKILLPEPHVGSIVVNRAQQQQLSQQIPSQQPQQNVVYNTPQQQLSQQIPSQQPQQNVVYNTPPSQNDINQYTPPTTQRTRPSTQRVKQHHPSSSSSAPKDYYPDVVRGNSQKNRNPFEVTTQRATLPPSRGHKYSHIYDQDAIQEVTSPKITKHDRPKKKRPQNVQVEQPAFTQTISNPYAQFKPMPNQIINDNDYYKVQPSKEPASTSTSTSTSTTSTSTTTTSTTEAPTTYFTYNTSPQVEFHSTNGQLYHDFNTAPKAPVEEHLPRFTTRPPPATSADEEFRMKQYFRQQDAFRKRPQTVNPTNPPYEQVHYTPVSFDYDREVNIPSTTIKQRVTFYTPTETPTTTPVENYNTVPQQEIEYNQQRVQDVQAPVQPEKNLPSNHRPAYNQNEIPDGTVEYEPNPYQLPSELPPLTPNLPGLVNDLQEKDRHNAIEQSSSTTPSYVEPEPPSRPTRRPINRVRKPVVSKVTSSVSYSESETASRRPATRIRRPYGSRGTAASQTSLSSDAEDSDAGISSTTRRPASTRNPIVRNPNRVRYQPTPEERQTLKLKPRKHYNGSKKGTESEDLDYQRDVLKQNYPVFKAASSSSSSSSSRRPTSPTAIPSSYAIASSTEGTSETQQVYTVTPSNQVDSGDRTFPAGLLEPMQIAQQYNEYKENYGPGYFPNQEDLNPTEAVNRNEINPVYTTIPSTTHSTTTTTTTEEPPATTTKRSPFIRRNYPRLRSTTTEGPATTTPTPEEKPSLRPRLPPRKVIKVRARTRRPSHPASSTATPEDEVQEEPKNNYRKLSRFNQDLAENDSPRRRYKQQFHLDGQESQWSPAVKVGNSNNFKPVNPKETRNKHKFENEPDIVTAGPENDAGKSDSFEVNVSANFGSSSSGTKTTLKAPNLKPEKSFAELLEEVMGKAPEEKTTEAEETTRTTEGTYFESQKTTIGSRLNRRGKWKKMRTASHNNESFETAESQNIGAQLLNSLYTGAQDKTTDELIQQLRTTTPMTPTATEAAETVTTTEVTTTQTSSSDMDDYELTTQKPLDFTTAPTTMVMQDFTPAEEAKTTTTTTNVDNGTPARIEEIATRRLDEEDLSGGGAEDDLETQPSLFSEVKKQLHELFAIEESEDQAVTAALAAVGRRRQEYTNIKRVKPETTTALAEESAALATTTEASSKVDDAKKEFHKNLMEHVVYATEKSTKVTSETEICYRGRCIRSEDLPSNHKLN